ncbi:MAG: M48 family metallopeptidase [Bacteroidia bacterium]|nr:M48 family metallopeptidase [Bacteroidia bacterium]
MLIHKTNFLFKRQMLGICLLVLSACSMYAQLPEFKNNYQPAQSTGSLPEVYTSSATEKTKQDINRLKNTQGVKNRSAKETFYVQSNFYQDKLLRSGRILFNDPMSKFVNKVADETFKSDPDLRKQLQIFVVKSAVVNAYCFDNGIILVNTGLLSQIDNEAQLSYILSHEVSHYIKKHSIETFVEKKTNRHYSDDSELDEYKYSQDNELEADKYGLKYFNATKYSYKGINGAFNVLKYSYLPFDEIVFKKNFFEDSNLVFPSEFFLKEITSIKKDENYDDSRSTHPNIKKRKDAVANELGEISDEGRQKFLVSQEEFYRIREMARFEQCRIELLNRNYATCIYNCYMLSQKYPENVFLKTTIGKALFEIAALKSPKKSDYLSPLVVKELVDDEIESLRFDYNSREGNIQQVFHFLDKQDAVQSAVLALHYNWKLKKDLGDKNTTANRLCDSLFVLLAYNNSLELNYFNSSTRWQYLAEHASSPNSGSDTATTKPVKKLKSLSELDETDSDSKTARIEKKELPLDPKLVKGRQDSISRSELDKNFEKYAFSDYRKNEEFKQKFKKAADIDIELSKNSNETEIVNKGGLGIEKVVILDPFYIKLDERFGGSVKFFEADQKLEKFGNILKDNAEMVHLEYEFLDSRTLKREEIERYNDYTVLHDWVSEFLNHDFHPNTLVLNNEASVRLKDKYKTKYLLWSGIVNVRLKKEMVAAAVISTCLLYPALFTIPYLIRKEEKTLYVSVLFNLENNKVQFYETVGLRMSDSNDFLNAFVYDTMLNIKESPKYKK